MDEKRRETAQKLLDAAYDFWNACHQEGQVGAVQWLTGTNGEAIIFTRGEYVETLINNIHKLPSYYDTHYFDVEVMTDNNGNSKEK